MKNKKIIFYILLIAFGVINAEDFPNNGVIATVLKIGKSVKSSGMADTYAGISGGLDSIYSNPAGMMSVENQEISIRYNKWFDEVSLGSFSYLYPFSFGNLGVSLLYLNYGSIEMKDESDVTIGSFSPYDLLAIISYSRKISEDLSIGINLKGFIEVIDNYNFGNVVLDIGGLMILVQDELSAGLAVQNIGLDTKGYKMPLNIILGVSFSFYGLITEKPRDTNISKKRKVSRIINKTDDHLPAALEVDYRLNEKLGVNLGLEYWYQDIAVRVGYKIKSGGYTTGGLAGLTLGCGFRFLEYELNYAFIPYGDLGITHNISFNIRL